MKQLLDEDSFLELDVKVGMLKRNAHYIGPAERLLTLVKIKNYYNKKMTISCEYANGLIRCYYLFFVSFITQVVLL